MTIEQHSCPWCSYPVIVDTEKGTVVALECTHEVRLDHFIYKEKNSFNYDFEEQYENSIAHPAGELIEEEVMSDVEYHNSLIEAGLTEAEAESLVEEVNSTSDVSVEQIQEMNAVLDGAGLSEVQVNSVIEEATTP